MGQRDAALSAADAVRGARFDAVIFDLDGLLLDTERLAIDTGIGALGGLGHTVDQDVMRRLVGIDARRGHQLLEQHLGAAIDADLLEAAWTQAMDRAMADGVPLRPEARDLLDWLDRTGMPRAVATNSATDRAIAKIAGAGLAAQLPVVVGFDAVRSAKPAPDVYLEAARRLGIAPARCLAFEDSDPGVRAALAAGMIVVQIPDMQPSAENRAQFRADSLLAGARAAGLIAG